MPTSVRLDSRTENLVRNLAKRKGQTKSEVIREAISLFSKQEIGAAKPTQPYDVLTHLIGCVDSGGAAFSQKTGEGFRTLIQDKMRARRSR